MTTKQNYAHLIRQIKSSNIEAFENVFKEFQENIFSYLYFKIGNSQVAEDILHDGFIKLWENRHQLKDNLSLPSYLYTIAKNLTLNYFRHQKVIQKFQKEIEFQTESIDSTSPLAELELNEINESLINTLEKLPKRQRVVFMMSRHDNLSYKEIAERLEISIKTVETQIGKALKMLRKILITDL